jgi:hypothetical protein
MSSGSSRWHRLPNHDKWLNFTHWIWLDCAEHTILDVHPTYCSQYDSHVSLKAYAEFCPPAQFTAPGMGPSTSRPSLHDLAIHSKFEFGSQRIPINEALGNHSSRTLNLYLKFSYWFEIRGENGFHRT